MPTYDYQCQACGHRFEKFQPITSAPIRKCPKCGKSKVKRLIGTGAGLIFKGSGFYITDYRDASYKDKAKADSGSSSSSEAKPADSTATADKKEAKSEPAPAPAKESAKNDSKSGKSAKKK